jgi:hypothetical protein
MISLPSRRFGGVVAILAVLLAAPGFAAGTVKSALGAVRVPGSDLEIALNAAKSQESAFQKQMEALQEELKKEMDAEALATSKKLEEFLKSIGIEQDSVNYVVGSLSIRSIDPQAETPKIPGLIAFALKTPVSADKIAAGIAKAADDEGEKVEFAKSSYKEVPVLALKLDQDDLPAGMDAAAGKVVADLCVALPADGKVVYFGQSAEVKAGIDRMLSGTATPRSEGLKTAKNLVPAEADGFIIFDMPDRFREVLSKQAANAGGNPMAQGPVMALAGLKGAAFSGVTTDKASMAIAGDFEAADNATMIKTAIDGVLAMAKMQLMNMGGGKPMPMVNSLKTDAKDTVATLSFEITVQDVRNMIEFSNRMKQGMGAPGAPGAPVPGAPGGVPAE